MFLDARGALGQHFYVAHARFKHGGGVMTLRQAAVAFARRVDCEASGKWMRRYLADRAPGAMFRKGDSSTAPWYTTEHLLRRYCPEFFSHTESAVKVVHSGIAELKDMIHELTARLNAVGARVRRLEREHGRTPPDLVGQPTR